MKEPVERDNDFDLEAQQRLFKVQVRARSVGWLPELAIEAANLALYLGHLQTASEAADNLERSAHVHPFHEPCAVEAEAAWIRSEIERLKKLPLRERRDT